MDDKTGVAMLQTSEEDAETVGLKRAQASSREHLELSQMVARLEQEQLSVKRERSKQNDEKVHLEAVITACENRISDKSQELKREEAAFRVYELEDYSVVQRAVEAYEHFLANGKRGRADCWPRRPGAVSGFCTVRDHMFHYRCKIVLCDF